MYNTLGIKFHVVDKRNHKAVGVERFYKFWNHPLKISTEARGSSEPFVEVAMATAYTWNASPLDGTDIIRSVPTIGRTLHFPLNIGLADIPALVDNSSASVVSFLRYLQRDVTFARQLLAYLVEDRRLIHREQVNEKEYLVRYKPGDIVMAKVNVKIKRSVNQSKGPFVVVKDAGFSEYMVHRYSKPNSALRKYMTEDLNIFPPAILPCEHLDTPDMQCLNSDFSRIKHIFDNIADIENYNIS